MRNSRLRLIIGGLVMSLFLGIFTNISTVDVSAASSADSIYKKTLLNAIKTCYNDTYMKKSVLGTDYSSVYSLMAGSQSIVNNATGSGGFKDGIINVPSQYGNSLEDANMSCYQLFTGWRENKSTNSAKGLQTLYGKTITENKLPNVGYERQEVSAGGYKQGCISFKYTAPNGSGGSKDYTTNQICMDVDSNNKINVYDNMPTVDGSGNGNISVFMDANYVVNIYGPDGMVATTSHSLMAGGGEDWNTFKSEFENAAKQIDGWINMTTYESYGFHFNSVNATLGNEDHYAEYVRDQEGDTAPTAALHYFAGFNKDWDGIKFDDEDRYTLYTAYIERYINDSNYPSVYIGADSKCSSKLADAKKETGYAYRKDKSTWCPLYGVEDGNVPKLNGIDSSNTKLTPMDFKDIVQEMMKTKYDAYAAAEGTNPIGTPDSDADDGDEDSGQSSPCSQAGQSLGWIICPVVQLVSEATEGIYKYIESTYLQMNPDFISDDGTRAAWGSFRSYANIIFAIVLAIIILSQITGFGVSNYGIKKMLPTIIVMAVLVNVSFFLCEVAVDLSNIVGYGAGKLFDGIDTGTGEVTYTLGGMVNGAALTFLSGAGTIGGMYLAWNTIEFWLLPFALMILVAFVSVVVFFILLGVRQAGIIILVTLAPVAIICYALPNTKKVFERWWKLFFSLLLVYPICGILMSGGQFASKLLLNVGSNAAEDMRFSYAFVAILLQAVPFFFVPSILKSSFAAMGNIGNKLSMLGSRFSRGAAGAIRRSEGYRDTQARLAGHGAQRAINRMEKTTGLRGLLNRPGNALRDKSHQGKIATMARNSRNRKMNRLQGTALAQSLANRDRSGAFTQRHVAELAKDYTDTWENDGTFAEESSAAAQLESALNDLRENHENVDARARFTAAMHNLNTSDPGRQYVDSVLNGGVRAAALAGQTSNQGIQWAASAVRNAAGGEYKAKNPTTFKNLNKLASGSYAYDANDIISTTDKDGNTFLANKNYLNDKAHDIGAEQLMNTDDMYRRNAIQGLQNGTIAGDERNNLIAQAREVMNNPNLTPKGDVARDMDAIANMDYAPPTGSASSNASVGTVDGASVNRMASASQGELDRIVRGVENGTIGTNNVHTGANDRAEIANVAEATLNAANAGTVNLSQETADKLNRIRALDGRSEISYTMRVQHNAGNSAPVPGGFEENGSGIVIPRNGHSGDMTGSQIRDFERQMRRHNNGGNNNRNNNGGGIILP